jgi:hypothetical protein
MIVTSLTQLDSIKVAFFLRLLPCTHAGFGCGANQRHNAGCRLLYMVGSIRHLGSKVSFFSSPTSRSLSIALCGSQPFVRAQKRARMFLLPPCKVMGALGLFVCLPLTACLKLDLENHGR